MLFRTLIRPEIRNAPFRWKISLRTCFLLLTVVACVLGIGCLFERAVLGKATGSFLLVVPGFYGVLAYKAGGNWHACAAAIFGLFLACILYADWIALQRIEHTNESKDESRPQLMSP